MKNIKSNIKAIKKDLGEASALEAVALSEGGKRLVDGFVADILGNLDTLCAKCKDLTHIELIAICLDTKNKLDVVRAIKNSKVNKNFLHDELRKVLKEAEELGIEEEEQV